MDNIKLSEMSRPLRIEDFLEPVVKNTKNNSSHENSNVETNQKHYGHRKRIKP